MVTAHIPTRANSWRTSRSVSAIFTGPELSRKANIGARRQLAASFSATMSSHRSRHSLHTNTLPSPTMCAASAEPFAQKLHATPATSGAFKPTPSPAADTILCASSRQRSQMSRPSRPLTRTRLSLCGAPHSEQAGTDAPRDLGPTGPLFARTPSAHASQIGTLGAAGTKPRRAPCFPHNEQRPSPIVDESRTGRRKRLPGVVAPVGDGVLAQRLAVPLEQPLRHPDLPPPQHPGDHRAVGGGLAQVVVVGDGVHLLDRRAPGDLLDALDPGAQLVGGVEVVVAGVAVGGLAEPLLVIAAVQANVADRGGGARGGLDRVVEQRLVDVDDADAALGELGQGLLAVPRGVADLQHQRQVGEGGEEVAQPLLGAFLALERPGELQQHGAQAAGAHQGVARAVLTSSAVQAASRSWVKRRHSLAVNLNSGLSATRATQPAAVLALPG